MIQKYYVIANWKMHKTAREATDYIEQLLPKIEKTQAAVYIAPPFTSIASAARFAKDSKIVIGAQNMSDARDGAFTGEIGALMLKEAGAEFVLIGHSERRQIFGETNEVIRSKVSRALQDDLQPILCVGETEEERKSGKTESVLREQIFTALEALPKGSVHSLMIAYEPVWAIGTGKSATFSQIENAHTFCRSLLVELFGKKIGGQIPILYGGSVKPENAQIIGSQNEVNGVLVGSASLDPETFASIILNIGSDSKLQTTKKRKS